ncbi:hypothetical protein [Microbacterium oxydans]|nr:hypothetical protein [Microbacterium oxydans]
MTGGSVAVSVALALIPVAAMAIGIVLGRRFRLDTQPVEETTTD